jgi:predicted SAM-dependent methyltransferase
VPRALEASINGRSMEQRAGDPTDSPLSPEAASKVLGEYLEVRDSYAEKLSTPTSGEPLLTTVGRRVVPQPARFRARMLVTEIVRPREERRAQSVFSRDPLLLHPGCQKVRKEGWVNIDLAGFPVELRWNLLRTLPLEAERADAVFHEHLLEHFALRDGLWLAREWFRVLKKGGVLRIGVPDAASYLRSYVDDPTFLHEQRPESPTKLLAVQELFYWQNHRTMYDFETMRLLLTAAGFEHVERSAFGESRLDPSPDSPHREPETLYVEAVK